MRDASLPRAVEHAQLFCSPIWSDGSLQPTDLAKPLFLLTHLPWALPRTHRLFYPTTDDPERATLCSDANGWKVEPNGCPSPASG